MKSIIGKNIRRLRREADMSAEQLGLIVGVTSSAIYQYEKGINEPPLDIIEKIALALNTTKQDLLGITEQKQNATSENPWRDATIQVMKEEIAFLREIVKQLTGKNAPTNFLKALKKSSPDENGFLRALAA